MRNKAVLDVMGSRQAGLRAQAGALHVVPAAACLQKNWARLLGAQAPSLHKNAPRNLLLGCVAIGLATSVFLQRAEAAAADSANVPPGAVPVVVHPAPLVQSLDAARAAVDAEPGNAKARYAYGELLRKSGLYRQAAAQFLDAANIDPTMYVAFHQIAQMKCEPCQVAEATQYLREFDQEKPNQLMLRVALSELLERQGEYYQAARALVDTTYTVPVPRPMQLKVKARVHYLLAKAKQTEEVKSAQAAAEQDGEVLPPPLPDNVHFVVNKAKDTKTVQGLGHTTLLP